MDLKIWHASGPSLILKGVYLHLFLAVTTRAGADLFNRSRWLPIILWFDFDTTEPSPFCEVKKSFQVQTFH